MLFNSFIFLIFVSVFFIFWPAAKRRSLNVRYLYITAFSLFFYGWWNWNYLWLILLTGLLDFFAGIWIERSPRHKKLLLALSLSSNLLCLASFKYSHFFLQNLTAFFNFFGYTGANSLQLPEFFTILPVGISFYTFQSMSYTIDVYRGQIKPTKNPLFFFAFVSFFPQLVAGPIQRADHLMRQLSADLNPTEEDRFQGMKLIVVGYLKKMVLADNLAQTINFAFSNADMPHNSSYWWAIMLGFSLQIYGDFSGYSDIAKGLARLMGIEFMKNFDHPYSSTSLREFWTRWHISLSTWFRDYVYIPLGGSRRGSLQEYRNLWITMLLSGFWHGPAWTYVAWGGSHAFFLSLERWWGYEKKISQISWGPFLLWPLVMIQIVVTWVFFRAHSVKQALEVIKIMFSFTGSAMQPFNNFLLSIIACTILYEYFSTHPLRRLQKFLWPRWASVGILALLIWLAVFTRGEGQQFIYFQF